MPTGNWADHTVALLDSVYLTLTHPVELMATVSAPDWPRWKVFEGARGHGVERMASERIRNGVR